MPEQPPWERRVYPDHAIFAVTAGGSRNYNLMKLSYYPLSYDGDCECLTLTARQELRVLLRDRTATEERSAVHIGRPETVDGPFGAHRQWIRDVVMNPEDLDRFYPRYEVPVGEPGEAKQQQTLTQVATPYGAFVSELRGAACSGCPRGPGALQ